MKKILVVDDENDVRESIALTLKLIGYEITTARNGLEALKELSKGKYDLVVLDMLMPEMSGEEVMKAIRDNPKLKDQKIFLLTVVEKTEKVGKNIMEKLKPADYLRKPFDLEEFEARVKKLLK